MGIHKLMDLLKQNAYDSLRKRDISYYSGTSIALDASMAMYQFLVSTQAYTENAYTQLTDSQGNKTGHLLGIFNRTLMLLQNSIKPVWVFDGKPPTKKNGQLLRRKRAKQEAAEKADQAEDIGDLQEALKQQQRNVHITKQEKEDCIKMLTLMGIPVVQAPGEAEAQCSYMCKSGLVDAVGTQDMDALTFGAKTLLRDFNQKKEPITDINHETMLKCLDLTNDQFIDLCILCGSDYTSRIPGIGPVKAYKLIQEYKTLESVLEHIKEENKKCEQGKEKHPLPSADDFAYDDARELFKNPIVEKEVVLKWDKNNLDADGLREFLIKEKNFAEGRVEAAITKIKNSGSKGFQPRLQAFFGKPTVKSSVTPKKVEKPTKGAKKK